MTTKKRSTRRKARKPKFIEVYGHKLTEAMVMDYQRCVAQRKETNRSDDYGRIEELGFSDFLAGYRPTMRMRERLNTVAGEAVGLSLAISSMSRYNFHETGAIRAAGCDLVKKLALELYYASAKLTEIAASVEAEADTKLQHWLEHDLRLEQIGSGVAHG